MRGVGPRGQFGPGRAAPACSCPAGPARENGCGVDATASTLASERSADTPERSAVTVSCADICMLLAASCAGASNAAPCA